MALEPQSEIRRVTGVEEADLTAIENFMQGAIYTWVKNIDRPFAVRDLVGGVNTDWNGTPLQVLYEKHIQLGKASEDAFKAAAKDLGWIVKAMIDRDRRRFSFLKSGLVNSYNWEVACNAPTQDKKFRKPAPPRKEKCARRKIKRHYEADYAPFGARIKIMVRSSAPK